MKTVPAFEYRHVVGFEETNLVGNVYFVNHLRWQGRCRELFLHQRCPSVLGDLTRDLALITTRCSCDYFAELRALDEITVRMTLEEIAQNRVTMRFEYLRGPEVVARGEQQIACMKRQDDGVVPTPIPEALRRALEPFQTS